MAGAIMSSSSSSSANKLKDDDKSLFVAAALLITFVSLMHPAHSSSDPAAAAAVPAHAAHPHPIDCGAACTQRCKLASRQNMCMRACGSCSARCQCVPPGTSGHKEVCPCYANMTTHGGKPKCP